MRGVDTVQHVGQAPQGSLWGEIPVRGQLPSPAKKKKNMSTQVDYSCEFMPNYDV